jgi:hypothetical protein
MSQYLINQAALLARVVEQKGAALGCVYQRSRYSKAWHRDRSA